MMSIVQLYLLTKFMTIAVKTTDPVTVVTVATDVNNIGYKRFLMSTRAFSIDVTNVGEGKHWTHFSTKILLLRNFLSELQPKNQNEHIVIIVDSYDLIFLSGLEEIIRKFKTFADTRVLFAAEQNYAPAYTLRKLYRKIENATAHVHPYLNAGGIIGYLPELIKMIIYKRRIDDGNDQTYFSLLYLSKKLRRKYRISLDHNATIFFNYQTRRGLRVMNSNKGYIVEDAATKERPSILHGPGPEGKVMLDQLYDKVFYKQFEKYKE